MMVALMRQLLILPHREVVKPRTLGVEVVRPHDGGVAPGIATADPARFEHGHIRDAMVLRKVVGRGQAVAAAADDDDVVARPRLGIAPGRCPVGMATPGGRQEVPGRVVLALGYWFRHQSEPSVVRWARLDLGLPHE